MSEVGVALWTEPLTTISRKNEICRTPSQGPLRTGGLLGGAGKHPEERHTLVEVHTERSSECDAPTQEADTESETRSILQINSRQAEGPQREPNEEQRASQKSEQMSAPEDGFSNNLPSEVEIIFEAPGGHSHMLIS